MSSNFDTSGLDKLKKNMEEFQSNSQVKLVDMLSPAFMAQCSTYSSFEDMLDASGFKVESAEDFAAIPDEEWDAFVSKNTSYSSWEEMQKGAAKDYTKRQLTKGL
ncbi:MULTISPECIES: hypothetical protein [Vreelandella]|jgi:hypothetical protein|uniref:Uncharacterized protein n=1 Tax=Vreelandella salicampi TaxID=1449798 RepID=A0A7Z0LN69_9GAMM|nr:MULTISPECIES: hypothetical protein [Halomonas]MCD1651795.1 hypothetical protein [Halomonas axialensis]MCD2088614.1 hypothetical protein [Halomonas meridiana]NYS61970.1 hypothetical protein [Halomonas salicampi]|tara:strand:- start:1087 stop:1401 length:315 start_codon:yes stop_codon:yes gene_type:complete